MRSEDHCSYVTERVKTELRIENGEESSAANSIQHSRDERELRIFGKNLMLRTHSYIIVVVPDLQRSCRASLPCEGIPTEFAKSEHLHRTR